MSNSTGNFDIGVQELLDNMLSTAPDQDPSPPKSKPSDSDHELSQWMDVFEESQRHHQVHEEEDTPSTKKQRFCLNDEDERDRILQEAPSKNTSRSTLNAIKIFRG